MEREIKHSVAAVEAHIAPQQGDPDFIQSAVTSIWDYGFRIVQQSESGLSADQSESFDVTIVAEKSADDLQRLQSPLFMMDSCFMFFVLGSVSWLKI